MDIALSIFVTILLTLVNGFFSMSEMALSTTKKAVLDHEAEEGDKRAAEVSKTIEEPGDFLAAIQVAITLVGFASSAFAATNLSTPFAAWMVGCGLSASTAKVLSPILITLVVSYLSIVVGELVPKRMAMANAVEVSKSVVGFLNGFSKLAKPLVWFTSASANGLATAFGIKSTDDRLDVSEDEIRYMVTDSDELSEEEKSMIHEVIDLGDTIAREVMVPRVDMTALEDTTSLREVLKVMRRTGYSRIPVYHDTVDRIVGIAHIKDIIEPIIDESAADDPISGFIRSADFVPDTKDIIPLLSEMQSSHDQMVIVVDEYGGTAGVITVEDIVEEVVGEIEDEFDPDNKYLTQLSENEWLVDGRFSIEDAADLGWPIEDSEEYETVAGFVIEQFDRLPRPGEKLELEGYVFRVQSTRGRRVSMLRVKAPQKDASADGKIAGSADENAAQALQ